MEYQNEIKTLNRIGVGIRVLSKAYHKSPKTIYKILGGKSSNNIDTKREHNRVYNAHLEPYIKYLFDVSAPKSHSTKSHHKETYKLFPQIVLCTDRRFNIVGYNLEFGAENSLMYEKLFYDVKDRLEPSSVIHFDIYSPSLFKLVESYGFKACHIPKPLRTKPYYNEVEHKFYLQDQLRTIIKRLQKLYNLDPYAIEPSRAKELVESVIQLYWFYNPKYLVNYVAKLHKIKAKVIVG